MDRRLEGKIAIVTGSASGLGRAIALRFAEHGAKVVVADLRREPRDEETPTDLLIKKKWVGESLFIQTDVSQYAQVERLVKQTVEHFGRLDVIVNCAGIFSQVKPSIEKTLEEWEGVISVNLTGVWYCCQAAIRQMLRQAEGGKVINISSRLGLSGGGEGRADYCASKGGVSNLTRQLAVEFGPKGITVNAICPGFIPMTNRDIAALPGQLEVMQRRTPFKRLGRPEDVAGAALFLASADADFVNGHNLVVDGGALVNPY